MTRLPASAAGSAVAALVLAAALLAWAGGSPLVPRDGGVPSVEEAPVFLLLLGAAYAAYVLGLACVRRGATRGQVLVLAAVIQLAPLAAPLLLSTDAWTYWGYGWTAAVGGGNPYVDPPAAQAQNPALPVMGADWTGTTSVYGPAFTLASEPIARLAGGDADVAAWLYKGLAAAALLAATLLAARLSRRPALAAAFVGWNPVLAIHSAGGGHNDAWVGALLLAALALEGARRTHVAGGVWTVAILVKWVPLPLLGLRLLSPTTPYRARLAAGAGVALGVLALLATWRYGAHWLGAAAPLAENAARETSFAIPARLEQAGIPSGVALGISAVALLAGFAWLTRDALGGRARLAAGACVMLLTTPYLAVWYLAWAVPLAGADDDDPAARACCLVLGAYLLPQAIPV